MGSIPLSTLDPLTLEPLSTYVRPDPPKKTKKGDVGDEEVEELDGEEEAEDMKERTTNIAGDPISLVLARLQTNPQGCACGCTVPDPPKHSDYYHAQHLLRLLFQTQRVRSRSLRMYLPGFFERFEQDEEGYDDSEDGEDERDGVEMAGEQDRKREQACPRDAVVIPMEGNTNNSSSRDSTLAFPLPPPPQQPQPQREQQQPTKRPRSSKRIPRY
ncbi:hypothetical protein BGW39_011731, partial [Mortierella sp. 14UC]